MVEWYWIGRKQADVRAAKRRFAGIEIGRNRGRKIGYYMRSVR